ncbi:N-acetyl-gamma-glutamyl-phosphate reductase [Rhodohalobacter sp. SW132]|uniref:N-acetyl-gamma-glutamyl-phosphate reductase n=1 Tax=Rhodohalobacter sp. SW132 TaxID=2293433 RepID=UPI000E271638|nr:N-acetyl-gamma-glutamyl-phosphate reductase [Rhodohalobacter sp. SW132]REL33203.1 N-acetyl-gamma-glutamyl-phosphate reductase [Rhodohalobacter sp. SW132]
MTKGSTKKNIERRKKSKFRVGVVGATGYTGVELIRLLILHPDVRLEVITSESKAGKSIAEIHPSLDGIVKLELQKMETISDHDLDLVFLALPHRVSMDFVKEYGLDKFRIVDLSGDFRLKSAKLYEKWYEKKHVCPDYLKKSVYGMPELNRDDIRNSDLVANPGCYPTSTILALLPLVAQKLIDTSSVIIDSKSGVTGAGASPKTFTHFPNQFGNFFAYGLKSHRHTPEIETILGTVTDAELKVQFTPHLLPIDRGILTTTYSTPVKPVNEEIVRDAYLNHFEKEHFVRVLDQPPSVKNVRGSNFCDVYATYDERTNRIITISAIDNLVKGAAGQAVQNMNLMFGLLENTGLKYPPLNP